MNDPAERQATLKAVLHYFYQNHTRSGAHTRHDLKYHLVWITKYRRSFIVGTMAERLKQILAEIAAEHKVHIIALEVMPEHVHMLVQAPPKYSPSQVAQLFKGISSKCMREEFLDKIKRYIWKEGTLWARGYYIASVANGVTAEVVEEYINNQKSQEGATKANSTLRQTDFFP
ncbi:IS200/IS605 family transposase [bacterium]|nr:MAG: IS200/IS605 family transposase [bacterium]